MMKTPNQCPCTMFNGSLNLQLSFPKYKMKKPLPEAVVKINGKIR